MPETKDCISSPPLCHHAMDPNYLSHLLGQISSSLEALHRAQLVSDADLNLIKARLPTPDGRPAPPQLALTANGGIGTVTAEWDYPSENVSGWSSAGVLRAEVGRGAVLTLELMHLAGGGLELQKGRQDHSRGGEQYRVVAGQPE